ncbi:SPW repeat protein [Streptomyces sp. NPDC059083]|uniref:SPW repeat protein n=1 Tax=Streptomyces sp. NPDC059083 TaxID=3346721 RepID=UPI0036C7271E
MTSEAMNMSLHPDIVALRAKHDKYELAAEAPVAQIVTGLMFLTGLYLAISPWVVGFNRFPTLTGNDLILGIALAVLAFGSSSAHGRMHTLTWVAPLIGLWTIIAPWVISGDVAHTATIWSNVVTGTIALVLGLASTALGMPRTK